jgi:hypothetical protein
MQNNKCVDDAFGNGKSLVKDLKEKIPDECSFCEKSKNRNEMKVCEVLDAINMNSKKIIQQQIDSQFEHKTDLGEEKEKFIIFDSEKNFKLVKENKELKEELNIKMKEIETLKSELLKKENCK